MNFFCVLPVTPALVVGISTTLPLVNPSSIVFGQQWRRDRGTLYIRIYPHGRISKFIDCDVLSQYVLLH